MLQKKPFCKNMSGFAKVNKSVLVLATSFLVTDASKKPQVIEVTQMTQKVALNRIFCIYQLVQFRKNKETTSSALICYENQVNIMTLTYASQLGLKVWKTNMVYQKNDGSSLRTFEMVISSFELIHNLINKLFF